MPDRWPRERPRVTNQVVLFQGSGILRSIQDRSVSGPTNPLAKCTAVGEPASRTPSEPLQVNIFFRSVQVRSVVGRRIL